MNNEHHLYLDGMVYTFNPCDDGVLVSVTEHGHLRQASAGTLMPLGDARKYYAEIRDSGGTKHWRPSAPPTEPPAGSWAATARFMARGDTSGFDWDQWKDDMKYRDM